MTITSKMTIEDYMKKASGRFKVVRQDLKPQKETQAASSDFNGILSTFKKSSNQPDPKNTKGLSVKDYRSHPVASAYNRLSGQLPADARTTCSEPSSSSTAYKEASEYLLGPETQYTPKSISPETASIDQSQRKSGLNNPLKSLYPTIGTNLSQVRSSTNSRAIEKAIQDAAAQYQLSPKLIKGVIKAESNYDANAVSPQALRD